MPEPTPPTKTPEMLAREAEIKRVQEIMERSLSTQKAEELADHHMEVGKATTSLFAFLFLLLSLPPPPSLDAILSVETRRVSCRGGLLCGTACIHSIF